MKRIQHLLYSFIIGSLFFASCQPINLFEKSIAIPAHTWKSNYTPSFTFTIKDTSSPYQVYLIFRHNDKYHYNNIWLNISIKAPGADAVKSFKVECILATDEKGWLTAGMDDIYEHLLSLNDKLIEHEISLRKPGDYTFTVEEVMREDPLLNVLNVGFRIEKKQ